MQKGDFFKWNIHFPTGFLTLSQVQSEKFLNIAADPEVVSLSAGNPSPDAFPTKEIAEISAKVLAENPISVLQYSVSEGYTPLRRHLTEYMKKEHNIGREGDDILITTGAQQVMDLCSKALVNEGDVVICEAPSFIGSLNTFRSYNAKLVGVPVEPDGMSITALEQALKRQQKRKIYLYNTKFSESVGRYNELEKRKAVYELAKKYGILILEDNPYGDLRYSGEFIPNIKSFDEDEIVIYCGSFSKVISPGMRVAYCIAPKQIFQKLVVCKQGSDVHTNIWSQYVCDEFITKYDFNAHLEKLRKLYTKKAQFCMDLLDKYASPAITYHKIDGGLSFGATCPKALICRHSAKKPCSKRYA